uniref:ATP-dependent RNA helicase DDX54 n=1 Tax=Geotrypetes seraphini TaxID=260995 RepID=A0A6P8S549_GEOSA|nr:ATP-dependent RNA helicase DDX54 [Geotrypetes seraphini]
MAQKRKGPRRRRQEQEAPGQPECAEGDGGEFESSKRLPAFPALDYTSDVEPDTREMVRAQNKKKKKSGGFQSMGLSFPVFKGVLKKGYKVPTPIQRKTIPVILDGKDVVAMARTGSGKTACFLIPMFEKLKIHSAQTGARALILSPTRELALQTLKFTKELGKFTGLKSALILGGDRMEDQFAALHENPDIVIATPGRLMHVALEMDLKLHSVEYVVFDEADRLFEMGFAEQLQEIIGRLPESRQTLLFSATLPKLLVEFARAGLTEPVLIRLDVDTKLSDHLKLAFFHVRTDDKPAVLLHLLRNVAKPQEQTVIFVATKHHAEYLKELLTLEGIDCSHIYSSLDQTARKINVGKFVHGKCSTLIVTDVAARGIDIPMLDNVINYNFPPKAKLFLHRVGRVARAGRSGTAYSLVAMDEIPYVFDLHLFLGRPLKLASPQDTASDADGAFGRVPQNIIDDEESLLITDHRSSLDLQNLKKVSENAYKQYIKSRPSPSPESIKRVKEMDVNLLGIHFLFSGSLKEEELERLKFVDSIKNYKSKATIFEINATSKTSASGVMRAKRSRDGRVINRFQQAQEEKKAAALLHTERQSPAEVPEQETEPERVEEVFSAVVGGKRKKQQSQDPSTKRRKTLAPCDEYYISYRPKDFESERGLSIGVEGSSSFDQQASGAMMDILGDQNEDMRKGSQMLKWDRKKKKFVGKTGQEDKKKIKTESGRLISNSYKKNLYSDWKKKYKIDDRDLEEETGNEPASGRQRKGRGGSGRARERRPDATGRPSSRGKPHSELRNKQQILKQRKAQHKQRFLQGGGMKRLRSKNRQRVQEMRRTAFGRGRVHGAGRKGKMRKHL